MASTTNNGMRDRVKHDNAMSEYEPFKYFQVNLNTPPIMKVEGNFVPLLARQMAVYYSIRFVFERLEMPEVAKENSLNSAMSDNLNRTMADKLNPPDGYKWKVIPEINWKNIDKNNQSLLLRNTDHWAPIFSKPDERWNDKMKIPNQFAMLYKNNRTPNIYFIRTGDGILRQIHDTTWYETI